MGAAPKIQHEPRYQELLAKLDDIPTLPIVAMKVNELINNPNSSSVEIASLLKKDQVLTAKILRLVNSSYYNIPGGVSDVQKALAYLGFNTIAQLVLGISVFSVFTKVEGAEFTMLDFWKHALGTAVCSEVIARMVKYPRPEETFTCGLLHDMGKLVMYQIDRQRLIESGAEAKKNQCSFVEVEKKWDLPGHSYLGEVMAEKWGLPQIIRLAIRYHHLDVSQMVTLLPSEKPVIQIVRLANAVCVKSQIGHSGDCSKGSISADMLTPFQFQIGHIAEIEKLLKENMDKAGAFLNVVN